jgi:signal transduction histidine kinase/putative methionine-R-sulfoxide reductase with GAF domain
MTSQPPLLIVPHAGVPGVVFNSLPPDPARHQKQLQAIMDIAWAVSSTLNVDLLLPRIIQKVSEIIKADRSTFFVVDRGSGELWSKVVQGAGQPEEIRLRIGEGVAGWVAESGEVLNLDDAYAHPRFDKTWDEQSGYRTRSLLCVPVYDRNLTVIAVIQCLNKQGRRRFDAEDEELLRCVSGQCAVALENTFLYESLLQRNRALQEADARLRRANTELEIMYDIERQISESSDLTALLGDILERACALLDVEAGAIMLASETGARLFAHSNGGERRTDPVDPKRCRALLARARLPTHTLANERGQAVDPLVPQLSGLHISELFTAPLSDTRTTIGSIQFANRLDAGSSAEWLLRMVSLLAGQVARGIVVKREREAGEREGRLSLLGHSVGAILHDLRTPMTAVGGYAELMAAESDPGLREEYVGRIGRALEHMETMTQEVLAFARGSRDVLIQKVYMERFVADVREMLLPEMKRYGVELVIDSRFDGTARFDENKIKRVLFNLARNACQAMGSGGSFTWTVRRQGERLIFECADTGPGISKEMEDKLFLSFASHGKKDGTGLGLAMAKKIIDAHDGLISCRSTAGQGATFRIDLPL